MAAGYRCPDCLAETHLADTGHPGVMRLDVHHDATCPTLATIQRGARAGVEPPTALTRADLVRLNASAGTWADPAPGYDFLYRAPTLVFPADLERVGLTPSDVPRLRIVAPPKRDKENQA